MADLTGMLMMAAFSQLPDITKWAYASGGVLNRTTNAALFAKYGTSFGAGDGVTTFGIPDCVLKAVVGAGSGAGLTTYAVGDTAGEFSHTLSVAEIQAHKHDVFAATASATLTDPTAGMLGASAAFLGNGLSGGGYSAHFAPPPGVIMDTSVVGNAGLGQPHDNMPPCNIVRFMIALVDPTNLDIPIGELIWVPDTSLTNYLVADGSSVATATYPALFAICGYTYGGSGANFNLPDARGRIIIGTGQGPTLTMRNRGDIGGEESTLLANAHIPTHKHSINVSKLAPDTTSPLGACFARTASMYAASGGTVAQMDGYTMQTAGSSDPHENRMPVVAFTPMIRAQ